MAYIGVRHKRGADLVVVQLHGPDLTELTVDETELEKYVKQFLEDYSMHPRNLCRYIASMVDIEFCNGSNILWAQCEIHSTNGCSYSQAAMSRELIDA